MIWSTGLTNMDSSMYLVSIMLKLEIEVIHKYHLVKVVLDVKSGSNMRRRMVWSTGKKPIQIHKSVLGNRIINCMEI